MKMPESGSCINLFPDIADAWDWRFQQGEFFDLARILCRISISNHQADVATDKINAFVAETFDQFSNINCRGLLVISRSGPRGLAETEQVGRDNRIVSAELIEERNPHMRGIAEPMNQNQ